MKIRNLPYKELNEIEQKVVREHFKECIKNSSECYRLHGKSIKDFWEAHRKIDTDNGSYDGWAEPKKKG